MNLKVCGKGDSKCGHFHILNTGVLCELRQQRCQWYQVEVPGGGTRWRLSFLYFYLDDFSLTSRYPCGLRQWNTFPDRGWKLSWT